ncbi:molybdate ABC transporter substrate-binding protein [Vibrio tritonius]|uniref:molybdate ABC transporter substrate-binding protein n=1 Tax=Vibrio tritonius TaxID=1435069 RepID=UPI000838EB27|nr:molybdate ABC transporter substrate-binding protein [Vibrio tritonius]
MKKLALFISAALLTAPSFANDEIHVYAASSMTNAMNDLAAAYEKTHSDVSVVTVYAGSSSLARQIESGAPADVFLSANEKWVNYLIQQKVVTADKVSLVAGNQLVLIEPAKAHIKAFDVKNKGEWTKLLSQSHMAVGNTASVPVGMYSKEALQHLGVWDTVQPKLAQANNVRLALALVERGEADLGMVYKTDAVLTNKVKIVSTFDSSLHTAIHYPLVQVSDSSKAADFVKYVKSAEGKKVLNQYGFNTDLGNQKFAAK